MNTIKKTLRLIPKITFASMMLFTTYLLYKSNIPSDKKLNLIFDLDSTLIYASKYKKFQHINKNKIPSAEFSLDRDDESEQYHVWIRPFCRPCLMFLSSFNNVYLFTKATEDYTTKICTIADIDKYFISKHFAERSYNVCKNLDLILPNISNNMKLLIDDNKINNCHNQNIYHISNYNFYRKYDYELLSLCFYIIKFNVKHDLNKIFKQN